MLTFEYTVNNETKLIWWSAKWDRVHNESWYTANEHHMPHPFSHTPEFKSEYELWNKAKERMAAGEKKLFDSGPDEMNADLTEELIKDLDPNDCIEISDVVALNPATIALCEMLSKKEEICKWSGWSDPYWYFMSLIGSLSLLWD